jgi:hypothetical protein
VNSPRQWPPAPKIVAPRMIAQDILAPAVVEEALALAIRDIRETESAVPHQRRELETELARVEAELGRLVGAIATGGQLEGLLESVRDCS